MSSEEEEEVRVEAVWSKAGMGTCLVVAVGGNSGNSNKSMKIALDMGVTPIMEDAIAASHVFVSHGHVDHMGGIFHHARAHSVTHNGKAPTYYVPFQLVPMLERARDSISEMDGAQLLQQDDATNENNDTPNHNCGGGRKSLLRLNLVGVHPGDEIVLPKPTLNGGGKVFVRAFAVDHGGHPALGYTIGIRWPPGLKEEYRQLKGSDIRDLVKAGIPIKADTGVERLALTYTGDTCLSGLLLRPSQQSSQPSFVWDVPLLICEVTYVENTMDSQQKATERGHMHIQHVAQLLSSFELQSNNEDTNNEHDERHRRLPPRRILLFHLSGKYSAEYALHQIALQLPRQFHDRCDVAIASFHKTYHNKRSNSNHDKKNSSHDNDASSSSSEWISNIQENGCISLSDYISAKGGYDHIRMELNNS
eukprot:CAMPEP_0198293964 /NCGR_PEP_ID=MMETSP1449-20131203/19766_1 /TAXON_ID=420275 /ORGANISM="Attheya septentrionalis, Strain CCMP2084" /LENGTH=419 /DNA_ID=CAMNT_0043993737 /DNA_START=28 /DNA_END=1287 /DNA_ORIENTATION=+